MILPTMEQMEEQVRVVKELSKESNVLYFDDFVRSLAPVYDKEEMPEIIKIAKSEDDLLLGDLEPLMTINTKDYLEIMKYQDLNMWRNQNSKEFSLHGVGLIEGNKAAPSRFRLFDTNPHCNIGGATGHGKSVLGNTLIITASLVHAPWKVQFFLSDPKITELKPYATGDVMPHINTVAATEDPEYAISMLDYICELMNKRNIVFEKYKAKNIAAFTEKTGLMMPMLILVLDELKAMLMRAGKRASYVDKKIQEFVALARNAGGRCVMLSQGVVTELDKATMDNVNIRLALGCNPDASEKLIGNSGASINLGVMGKIVYNESSAKKIEDNVHLTVPFLPDEKNNNSNDIYALFEHQKRVWETIAGVGARISPLSFFDQTKPLTREEFMEEIQGKVAKDRIFIGEPVYINKSNVKFAYLSLVPRDEFDEALGNNILVQSTNPKVRYTMTSMLLANFEDLKKREALDVRVYSSLSDNTEKIKSMGYNVDGYVTSISVADKFKAIIQQTNIRIINMQVDEAIFKENANPNPMPFEDEIFKIVEERIGYSLNDLSRKRVRLFLSKITTADNMKIFDLDQQLNKDSVVKYAAVCFTGVNLYRLLNCETIQATTKTMPTFIRMFFNYHTLEGVETKKHPQLDLWMNIVRLAPVYGVHFIIITDTLQDTGGNLNGVFKKILYYYPATSSVNQQKLGEEYPDSTLKMMVIFADKGKVENVCVKVKYPLMLGDSKYE